MVKDFISPAFESALTKLGVDNYNLFFEVPKNPDHGDLSSNIAMALAKQLKKAPRKIAEDIINNLEYNPSDISKIEIAGAGFINIKFCDSVYIKFLQEIINKGNDYGKSSIGSSKRVNVEYVSANPTGLLHLGHGRNAAIGDTIANLYEWMGYEVSREYYFNNSGNQMNNLAKSIKARYFELLNDDSFPFPEDGYHGEYVKTIAEQILKEKADSIKEAELSVFRKYGEVWCFERIKQTLKRMHIEQDIFYNESSLYEEGKIDEVVNELKAKGLAYEKDNALWLKLSEMGLEDDRVIIKSTGEATYRLPDIAYHIEKFRRKFDVIVDVFGADHIATIPDVMAAVKALGYDSDKIKVLIHQFVTLTENGEQVKMSKRSGKSYTLDDLIEEVGADVVRFFLINRGITTHLEFDMGLAREQSDKNPVFYLQYAHARISSLIDRAKDEQIEVQENTDLSVLKLKPEIDLIKELTKFEEKVIYSGTNHEPQVLAEYLRLVAAAFHAFYHECRIIGEPMEIAEARIKLAKTTRIVLRNGLSILGISSPIRM